MRPGSHRSSGAGSGRDGEADGPLDVVEDVAGDRPGECSSSTAAEHEAVLAGVLPDLLGQRLQDDVVGGDVTPGRPGLQRPQLSSGAALLADAHRPAEEVDVLHPQSAHLADPQTQADQREHQGPVEERCRGEHRGDVVVGQVDRAP